MHVQTQVTIAAPPARVWELLTDAASYPSWNPMVRQLSGDLEVGKTIKFKIALGKLEAPLAAEVVAMTPERELRWVGLVPKWTRKVLSGEHYFVLRAEGEGTVLEHGEQFTGWLMPEKLKLERIQRALAPAYEAFNKAIKAKAEAAVEAKPAVAATA